MRLIASVILCAILLPYILRVYLAISPGATAREIWLAFVQVAPFGESIATAVLAVWGEAQSGTDSLLEWFASQKFSFPQHFTMELGEMVFISVFVLVFSSVIGRKFFQSTQGGLYNQLANAVFQVFLTFAASLAVDLIFKTFTHELSYAMGLAKDLAAWIYAAVLGAGGIGMLMVCGVVFLDAILLVAIGCLKLTTSYGIFFWLLLNEMQGGSNWFLVLGALVWLGMIWFLQSVENLFLPA